MHTVELIVVIAIVVGAALIVGLRSWRALRRLVAVPDQDEPNCSGGCAGCPGAAPPSSSARDKDKETRM